MSTETSSEDRDDRDQAPLSEEEARGLVEQLRSAPAEQIVSDVFSTLLSTAQVKLGRRDARLFIDLCAMMSDYAGRYLSEELGKQVDRALGQLRLGQVGAEQEMAKKGESEPNDLSRVPTPPPTGDQAQPPPAGQAPPPSSRLWIPGR